MSILGIKLTDSETFLCKVLTHRRYLDCQKIKALFKGLDTESLYNLRPGDIVNVHSLDRVGRNTKDILSLVETIKEIGATIVFHKENLTFDGSKSDLYSDLMLTILSGFAQFERNIILERQREGIAIAKANGKYLGRAKKLTDEQLTELKQDFDSGMAKTKIADKYNVTRSYVYQLAKQAAA